MKRLWILVLLVGVMVFPSVGIVAQDDDESAEMIAYVANAVDKLAGMNSVYSEGEQVIDQEITAQGATVVQNIVQEMTSWVINEERTPVAMDATIIQVISSTQPGMGDLEVEQTLDMRLVDDTFYLRARDMSPELAGVYPNGWQALDANAGTSFPGFEGIDPQTLQSQILGAQFTVPLDETTVIRVEELEPETFDGVEMRVFEMRIDPEALMQTDMMSGLTSAFQGVVTAEEFEDLLLQMAAGMTYDMTVFVNAANNVAERVEVMMITDTEITLMGVTMDLVQELTGYYTYSNFGDEVEIEAPDTSDF